MDGRKKKPYAFTADDDFIQRIRNIAEKERRTLSQMIYILLEEALEARDKAAK